MPSTTVLSFLKHFFPNRVVVAIMITTGRTLFDPMAEKEGIAFTDMASVLVTFYFNMAVMVAVVYSYVRNHEACDLIWPIFAWTIVQNVLNKPAAKGFLRFSRG